MKQSVSEKLIAFYYTLALYGIFNISRFTKEDAMRMKDNMGETAAMIYAVYAKMVLPFITVFAGYMAVYLTFCFIRQITAKGGK